MPPVPKCTSSHRIVQRREGRCLVPIRDLDRRLVVSIMHPSLIGGVCLPVDPSLARMIHRPLFLFVSFRSRYYVDSRLITVGDLDMVGNATRVWCEKYSRESSCTRSTEVQALPVLTTSNSNRPLTQCFSSALTKRRMKHIHRVAIDAL